MALKSTLLEVRTTRGIVVVFALVCGSFLAWYFFVCVPELDYRSQHAETMDKLIAMTRTPVLTQNRTMCLENAAGFTAAMLAVAFVSRLIANSGFGRRASRARSRPP
jgi:hypothetical protein